MRRSRCPQENGRGVCSHTRSRPTETRLRRYARSARSSISSSSCASGLIERGVTSVAMEATGVYWKPVVRHEALFDREEMK